MTEFGEIIEEFVVESLEGLDQVDAELLKLEADPDDQATLQSIFRTIHSMKGACGFLEFDVLESLAHAGESLLDALREGQLGLTGTLITTLLEMNDALRSLLGVIQESGTDKDGPDNSVLVARLKANLSGEGEVEAEAKAAPKPAAASPKPKKKSAAPKKRNRLVKGPAKAKEPTSQAETTADPEPAPTPAPKSAPKKTPEEAPKEVSEKAASGAAGAKSASQSSIRLRVEQLDALMNLAGELVLVRNQVVQHSSNLEDPASHTSAMRLSRITTELQEGIMKIRMQPINTLWSKLPRVVRGMSMQLSKEVELRMEGAGTEVDKTLLEAIKDPLTHLVRNSLDHGIESPDEREAIGKPRMAVLTMRAFHESGQVNIIVKDDGRGINPESIRAKAVEKGIITEAQADLLDDRSSIELLFTPGFSTAEKVTSISGRGVGMDVVKRNLERVGGTVEIESELGRGTEVIVRIPLTLAIIPALTVHSGGNRYVIPQANLVELLRVEADDPLGIEEVMGQRVFRLRGQLIHLVDLNNQLETESTSLDDDHSIVVVQASGRTFGLLVDGIYESEEIVVKPLDTVVKALNVFAGTTILADGQVALILDIAGLAERARLLSEDDPLLGRSRSRKQESSSGATEAPVEYLVVAVGEDRRIAMDLNQVDRLEDLDPSTVEKAGTLQFVQYRGELLQLIDVGRALGVQSSADPSKRLWKTVVRSHAGFSYGLVVDDVLDIIEADACEARHESPESAIAAVLVVGGEVTELVEENWLVNTLGSTASGTPANVQADAQIASAPQDPSKGADGTHEEFIQLCTLRHGGAVYGIDVLDVQEVLMPQKRTPIPLSPPEVGGLLNLRGDTVLSFDLGAVLAAASDDEIASTPQPGTLPEPSTECDRMNVVVRTSQGAVSMLVDEVGEVMTLPQHDFEGCPSTLTDEQQAVARGVFKLDQDLLIQLDVDALYGQVEGSPLLTRA
jgi:two-component system chemotaxis sensor kinase CheA